MTNPINPTNIYTVPSVSIATARTGASSKADERGMRAMQQRAYARRMARSAASAQECTPKLNSPSEITNVKTGASPAASMTACRSIWLAARATQRQLSKISPWITRRMAKGFLALFFPAVFKPGVGLRTRQHGQREPIKRLRGCHGPLGRHDLSNQGVIKFDCHGLPRLATLSSISRGK